MGLFGGRKKGSIPSGMPPPMPGALPPMGQFTPSQQYNMDQQNYNFQDDPRMMSAPEPQQQFQQPIQYPQQYSQEQKMSVEETVEAVIDEKWNILLKDINKIIEWKERTDATVNRIQQEIDDLKNNFDTLNKSLMSKISAYDQNIRNVGVDIQAMEQVFQRILPKFTDNVNKLSRITDQISKK